MPLCQERFGEMGELSVQVGGAGETLGVTVMEWH